MRLIDISLKDVGIHITDMGCNVQNSNFGSNGKWNQPI